MPESRDTLEKLTREPWRPSVNPWLITASVMLATFMEVLDTSVANVSLPHIAGSLSASLDESTWVLTSYLVSNAIVLPMTGWLSRAFGRKRFLLVCIAIFTFSSFLCGAATSLGMIIVARIFQGIGGGALQPTAQAILLESFPPNRRGAAMAAYAFGVVIAPIVGPTLGGWITDNYSWRWIFYINIPVGILAIFMISAFVEDPPYIRHARAGRLDVLGFSFLVLWLGTLQIILDKGQQVDWFAVTWMRWFAVVSVVSMIGFILWELRTPAPLVDLQVLKNRNLAVGTLLVTVVGAVLYSTIALLPLFLQNLMGYPALQSGLAVSPRGFGSIMLLPFVGWLSGRLDNRFLIATGFLLLAYATYDLGNINLEISMYNVVVPNVISGMALALLFVPLSTTTMGTLHQEQIGSAAGIYNLMRNIGGSVGISSATTLLARSAQAHQVSMVSHLTPYDPEYLRRLGEIQAAVSPQIGSQAASQVAVGHLYGTLLGQASLWSFVDNFRFYALLCLLSVPLVFLFRRVKPHGGPGAAVH